MPSLRGEGAAGRCEARRLEKPEAYSLEYVEDFFWLRTTQWNSPQDAQKGRPARP
jgi:hypothetical protein